MRITFTKKFDKQLRKSPDNIKKSFHKKLAIFIEDRYYPLLLNHRLAGKLHPYRSINITSDWRAIFRETSDGNGVYFVSFGTHSQFYQ